MSLYVTCPPPLPPAETHAFLQRSSPVREPHRKLCTEDQISMCQLTVPSRDQLCPALCNPVDCSQPGSSVHGIFQRRILEWVVISYSRGCSRPRDWSQVSCVSCIGWQILYHWAPWEAWRVKSRGIEPQGKRLEGVSFDEWNGKGNLGRNG